MLCAIPPDQDDAILAEPFGKTRQEALDVALTEALTQGNKEAFEWLQSNVMQVKRF